MKLKKRIFHLLCATRNSFISLAVGLLLLFFAIIGLHTVHNPNLEEEIPFLLGIVASIIATLILRVSERYSSSCLAVSAILDGVEDIATYIETVVINDLHSDVHKFKLWQMYAGICEKSETLSYKRGFSEISREVSTLVELVYHGRDKELLISATDRLRKVASNWML